MAANPRGRDGKRSLNITKLQRIVFDPEYLIGDLLRMIAGRADEEADLLRVQRERLSDPMVKKLTKRGSKYTL